MNANVYEACHNLVKGPNGTILSPDECLGLRINHICPIPLMTRDELHPRLPSIDTKVVHYFLTQLILQRYPHLVGRFDETSLITISWLLEKWIAEYLVLSGSEKLSDGVSKQITKPINYRYSPADI
ncbi:factor RRN10 [Kluyveromyces marxianus]|uniref:Factor RRN10 n=2 Tax=Kluyveromyces marxianus TaxID=4911 RepID=W0T7Q0_KLUMD|nr:factor RRN10 [Kluyveromyces marxianus DMKU3-1042]QGN15151.1 factor RRN10 [Kluyveromyces marxianus]BAO39435.1 factor RRN10 [Kluyveromyces marxianus DMKU3-1042]